MKHALPLLILALALPLAAQTNGFARTWTAADGKQIAATLRSYKSGIVTLRDSRNTLKIKDTALSDADRKYLVSVCDPYKGITESEIDARLRQLASPAAEDTVLKELRDLTSKLEAEKREAEASIAAMHADCLTDTPAIGDTGRIQNARATLNQILGPDTALITYRYTKFGKESRQVILEGFKTAGMADDTPINLPGRYEVTGTAKFDSLSGPRTVFTIRRLPAQTPPAP